MSEETKIIEPILRKYYDSFLIKTYTDENNESDILMDVYNISPELKRENRQYWGRELGMIWQLMVVSLAKEHCGSSFQSALRFGDDEPCDLIIGKDAIDTKYRIGSGDSGTLKKFKQYGKLLSDQGYRPVFLMLREDNLPAAITAAHKGGWTIYMGKDALLYLEEKTGVDVQQVLKEFGKKYYLNK